MKQRAETDTKQGDRCRASGEVGPASQLEAEIVRLDSKLRLQPLADDRRPPQPPRLQKWREGDTDVVQGFGFPGKGDLGQERRVCGQCHSSC